MQNGLRQQWADEVVALCDPVFAAADVGFQRTTCLGPDGTVVSLLWEADPALFADRYPDSGVVEAYGEQWADVHCLDYWVTFDEPGFARIGVEGWQLPDLFVRVRGRGVGDGHVLRNTFARLLAVAPPDD